jgi:hypothetical protein
MPKIKFKQVSRTIDPKTGIHYLDAVDTDGIHWTAQVSTKIETWPVFTRTWQPDPQQPTAH